MKDKYLPIGTIVTIKGSNRLFSISGYFVKKELKDPKVYDYMLSDYPGGINLEQLYMVNREDIDVIMFIGYQNESFNKYERILHKIRKIADEGKKIEDVDIDTLLEGE